MQQIGGKNSMELHEALSLAKQNRFDEAIGICNSYIERHPKQRVGYEKRAHVYSITNELHKAIYDIDKIENLGLLNSGDYFYRGRWKLMVDDYNGAIDDLTLSIEDESKKNESYYSESSFFYRALAYLFVGNKNKVARDCVHVRDDFQVYVKGKIRSKADLLTEIAQ